MRFNFRSLRYIKKPSEAEESIIRFLSKYFLLPFLIILALYLAISNHVRMGSCEDKCRELGYEDARHVPSWKGSPEKCVCSGKTDAAEGGAPAEKVFGSEDF